MSTEICIYTVTDAYQLTQGLQHFWQAASTSAETHLGVMLLVGAVL